ncbi:hypothetical protein Q7P36_008578 [Cladosporium allicinum]
MFNSTVATYKSSSLSKSKSKAQDPSPTSLPVNMSERQSGTVKWFNGEKGYGFISSDSGADLFVHFRAIEGSGFRELKEGQSVTFETVQGQKGEQADKVRVEGDVL